MKLKEVLDLKEVLEDVIKEEEYIMEDISSQGLTVEQYVEACTDTVSYNLTKCMLAIEELEETLQEYKEIEKALSIILMLKKDILK